MPWYSILERGPGDFVVQTNRGRHVHKCATEAEATSWIARQGAHLQREVALHSRAPSKLDLARNIQLALHGKLGPKEEAAAQSCAKRSTAADLQAAIHRLQDRKA